ncbi:LTA synthase family protein [Dysgonomonas sp. 511]|uniref:LTA synthase family protein n=1 Tax=Dysgonomonas sp. 511 TaxID=2302930 RepID=UPI0013CF57E8|nr:alkaline phosphatase family protein [Dysgonomonas sp. 511]NDV79972.1 alkaline phosphatase family protein [Dysgonomonas sp. 511]
MKKPLAVLRYLASVHILALIVLAVFRLVLYFTNIDQAGDADNQMVFLSKAMLKGVQFDNLISCYIIVLPAVVLLILSLFNRIPSSLITIFNVFFIVGYALVFAVSAADIPYFSYFFSHLGASAFGWFAFGGTVGMILQESSYYVYIAVFLFLIILFGILIFAFGRKLKSTVASDLKKKDYAVYIPLIIIVFAFCFLGIRGSLGRYPLRVSGAYFGNVSLYNQLGINPAFYLIKSMGVQKKQKDKLDGVMSVDDAIVFMRNSLRIDSLPESRSNPINRYIEAEGEAKKANVVVILLESMANDYLGLKYNGKPVAAYMNELIGKSYYFENFYSAGIHTNNGIASSLYGFPAIFERPMMNVEVDYYTGLPVNLKEQGYETMFFLTHDPQYDNMYSFLSENGFDHVYSQYDYPQDKVVNNFGVQDDYLFEFGLNKLNEIAEEKKPFLATFMTVSNHPPYIVPDRFTQAGNNDQERIIAFMDTSLKEFMEKAQKQAWFKNTIFVILGDHGAVTGKQGYDMPISYNHVPLFIYSPLFNDVPRRLKTMAGQTDIFPTVMGLLNRPYINDSFGIDLFKEKRDYSVFVSDNYLGCIDNEFFYLYNPHQKTGGLYKYREKDIRDFTSDYAEKAESMKSYAISTITLADYLVKNKLVRSPK